MERNKMTKDEKLYLNAKDAYYNDMPIMSDAEFDALELKLKQLGSVVIENVGASVTGNKVKHLSPMLSLSKFTIEKEVSEALENSFLQFFKNIKNNIIEVSPKYDGNAVSVQYIDGKLYKAISRGNGIEGQDITNKLTLPKTINSKYSDCNIEIRGEVVMKLSDFNKYYSNFKNPRNLVAGFLAKKDITNLNLNHLVFIPYEVKYINKHTNKFTYENEIQKFLKAQGFKYLPLTEIYNLNNVTLNDIHKTFTKHRETIDFQLDGFVIKAYHNNDRLLLGENNHHPKWAIAIKFPPKLTITKIKDIKWTIGKQGVFTPIAILDPVDLDGSTISKCSLHNYANVISNRLYPGAEISLKKAGDIIPQIELVIKQSELKKYNIPTKCPYCNSELKTDDVRLYCANNLCPGTNKSLFTKNIALFEIDYFGGKTLEKIYEGGIVNPLDLLDPEIFNEDFLNDIGFKYGSSSATRLLNEIKKVQEIELWKLIIMTNVPNLGEKAAKEIEKMLSKEEWSSYGLQNSFFEMFSSDTIYSKRLEEMKDKIFNLNLKIKSKETLNKTKSISSNKKLLTIELTGSPKIYGYKTKQEFLDECKKYVDLNSLELKATTDYLVCEDYNDNSSKMKKANKLGVKIITYDEFLNQIRK